MKLDYLDFDQAKLDEARERQRLGNVLAVCQCLLLVLIAVILLFKS